LRIVRADVPNNAAFTLSGVQHFGERQMSFAEATTGDEDTKARGALKHFELAFSKLNI